MLFNPYSTSAVCDPKGSTPDTYYNPAQLGAWQESAAQPGDATEEVGGSLNLQRRKELNRIKKRYGTGLRVSEELFILSMKQIWLFSLCINVSPSLSPLRQREKEVKELEGYSDRAQHRYMYIKFTNSLQVHCINTIINFSLHPWNVVLFQLLGNMIVLNCDN